MNRILSRILAVLLSPAALWGQTATTAPVTTTTAQPTPTQPIVITVPKAGTKMSFVLSPQNIPPLPVNIPALIGKVNLSGLALNMSCKLEPGGTFVINPDQSITVTGLTCSLTK